MCQCVFFFNNNKDDKRSSCASPNCLVGNTVQTVTDGSFRSRRDNNASQLDDELPLPPQADILLLCDEDDNDVATVVASNSRDKQRGKDSVSLSLFAVGRRLLGGSMRQLLHVP